MDSNWFAVKTLNLENHKHALAPGDISHFVNLVVSARDDGERAFFLAFFLAFFCFLVFVLLPIRDTNFQSFSSSVYFSRVLKQQPWLCFMLVLLFPVTLACLFFYVFIFYLFSFNVFITLLPGQEAGKWENGLHRTRTRTRTGQQQHHLRGLGIQKRSIVLLFPLLLLWCTNGAGRHHTMLLHACLGLGLGLGLGLVGGCSEAEKVGEAGTGGCQAGSTEARLPERPRVDRSQHER